jgi:hypothetical protein
MDFGAISHNPHQSKKNIDNSIKTILSYREGLKL